MGKTIDNKVIINKKDIIPGNIKPAKDYEKVLAWNGKELFVAYIVSVKERYSPKNTKRIWKRDENTSQMYISEEFVESYLSAEKVSEILSLMHSRQ